MIKSMAIVVIIGVASGLFLYPKYDFPVKSQARLILKILTMDENFTRFGDPIVIGVSSSKMLKAFDSIPATLRVKGRTFFAKKMSDITDIERFNVVYIDRNWEKSYNYLDRKRPLKLPLIFCQERSLLDKSQGGICFKIVDGKPRILYSSENTKRQGSLFNMKFRKVAVNIHNPGK